MRARLISFVLLGGLLAVVGCSKGPNVAKVSGVATHKGQPVPNLRLTFQPDVGRPSWGDTDENGRFTLEYDADNKGALVGKHTVSAAFQASSPEQEMSGKVPASVRAVTAKYGDSLNSPLKIEITGATENLEVKFD